MGIPRAVFVLAASIVLLTAFPLATPATASISTAPTWGHARIVEHDGNPVFEVDGKPFFLYGAAFFYERLPPDLWEPSMRQLQSLGINTLDLYVPWNWHELADGDFDFTGRTNPRRDLHTVLKLAQELGFEIVLRPGPVIRNEWRNGGYPAWLLSRPEYGMPLHDLLEGRYPPTATLQNAHSDDAAAEWMRNATHVKYAKRWLERVLQACAPYADRIVSVALDDDQGAYYDNQTWPAPHFQAYIGWLNDIVHGVTGPSELTFINTYQMKVTASSPVWAQGNWYQSDAYELGEHDLAQLEFSTALLQTRPNQPLFTSEFQAGWLEGPDDIRPRPADPSNTLLADATMIGMGVRGIVNFPAQDTIAPAGWEAPFSNEFYAWDAALALDGVYSGRASPTAELGALVRAFGSELAATHPLYDAAILYTGSLMPTGDNSAFSGLADTTMSAQRACRDAGLSCALVDSGALTATLARHFGLLIVPPNAPAISARAASVSGGYGRVVADPTSETLLAALRSLHRSPVVTGIPGGRFARADARLDGFLIASNFGDSPVRVSHGVVHVDATHSLSLPPFTLAPHGALVVPVGVRLHHYEPRFAASDRLVALDCMPLGYHFGNGFASFSRVGFNMWVKGYGSPGISSAASCAPTFSIDGKSLRRSIHDSGLNAYPRATWGSTRFQDFGLGPMPSYIPPPVATNVRRDAALYGPTPLPVQASVAIAYRTDVYRDGYPVDVLDNGIVRVIVSPNAGGRSFAFMDDVKGTSCFTSVGAMRDDVAVEPPLSTSDRIAKYTHDMPAGMFNRTYASELASGGSSATFDYDAPDVLPNGARFARTVSLAPRARAFDLEEGVDFHNAPATDPQRAVSVTSLSVGAATTMDTERLLLPGVEAFQANTTREVTSGHALGYYDVQTHELATIAWRAGDVERAVVQEKRFSILVRLTLARDRTAHMRYGYDFADTLEAAAKLLADADTAAQVPTAQGTNPGARTN